MSRSYLTPGFRFHPTDVELVMYYLKNKILGKKIIGNAVAEVNVYAFSPWDLPDKSSLKYGDLEWYFFCPKAKKYTSGCRINRATETGFWKATGKDRKVNYKERTVATIKTLIFHLGHAGKGERTNWVMHEYRMEDEQLATAGIVQDTYVLCRIFEKSGSGPKNGAQYGAPFDEDEWNNDLASCSDSQAVVGLVGASNTMDYYKQKGHATTSVTEPGTSMVTFSANEPPKTLNYKQKGSSTTSMTGPGSSIVTISANEPTKNLTEPGSSNVMFPANKPINTLNYKQKGPANMDNSVPQSAHGLLVTEPGSSSDMFSINEMPAIDDLFSLEDLGLNMGPSEEAADGENVKTMGPDIDYGFYDELMNIFDLEDLDTRGFEYTFDELSTPGDPDLGGFYID